MIQSFKNADTQTLFSGKAVPRFVNISVMAERKLQMLHRAARIEDLRIPPQSRLEKLKDNRKGSWSIRVNDPWRVCFRFESGNAFDVEIVDYH